MFFSEEDIASLKRLSRNNEEFELRCYKAFHKQMWEYLDELMDLRCQNEDLKRENKFLRHSLSVYENKKQ